jgi:hypothetical protein
MNVIDVSDNATQVGNPVDGEAFKAAEVVRVLRICTGPSGSCDLRHDDRQYTSIADTNDPGAQCAVSWPGVE